MRFPSRSGTLAALGLLFLYLPILVVVLYAFNDSRLVAVWTRPSLRWFERLFQDDVMLHAAGLSLRIALLAASCATILGTLAALVVQSRAPPPLARLLSPTILGSLAVPDVVFGFAYLLLFVMLAAAASPFIERGATTIWIAHVTLALPYTFMIVRSRLTSREFRIQEAAADLGATPLQALRRVTLPLLLPALLSAWLAAFVVSFDDVVVASFVAGPGSSTLPMVIFSSVRLGVSPEANALAALLFALVALLFAVAVMTMIVQRKPPVASNEG
jgi:putrescine transport system permease protein